MKKLIGISLALSTALLAKDFVVCNNGCPYNSIQAAINDLNNSAGEYNITIKPGIYNENIDINKSVNLIGDGDPKKIILTGNNQHTIIDIETDGDGIYEKINISNLTVKDGTTAVYINSGLGDKIKFKNVIFEENTGDSSNSGLGGAVDIYEGAPTFEKCEFDNNKAQEGGAIYLDSSYGSNININDCNFNGNIATDEGGAIYIYRAKANINRSWFVGNSAINAGGAIYNGGNLNIKNSIFTKNTSQNSTSAISLHGSADIEFSDFVNNPADENYSAVYVASESDYDIVLKDNVFKNSKLWIDKDNDSNNTSANILMNNNVLDKNELNVADNVNINNNIFIDNNTTLFVNPNNFNFSLTPNSILKDKVNEWPDTDIAGTPRPQGSKADIGACEYPSQCKFQDMRAVVPVYTLNNQAFIAKNVVIDVEKGWNLKSIPYYAPIKISDIIKGDEDNIRTIWFWDAQNKKWEVYSPNPEIQKILKEYKTLDMLETTDTINVGAGFWIDATEPFEINVPVFIQN